VAVQGFEDMYYEYKDKKQSQRKKERKKERKEGKRDQPLRQHEARPANRGSL
jgi:hypothetical protein